MKTIEKPDEWTDRERIRLIEHMLYRISAERLNIDRRARLINIALDLAGGAPELLDRRWLEMAPLLIVEDPKGLSW